MRRGVYEFAPLNPPRVGMFVCGITPYAEAHVGHGRTAVFFDVVARALRRWGYRVLYVQNVTNLDDKVIDRARAQGVDPLQLSERHFAAWLESMAKLGVRSVNVYPFATDYLPEIVEQIGQLMEKGYAYAVAGDVYYDVTKFARYGRLSGQRREAQQPGTRVEVDPKKRAPEDFSLWKSAKPGEPAWESPWGPGRPGWHIEDTAITVRLLGPRYDIHGAGLELKFPHHEAEIAQAEAATGKSPLVNYWMHAGLLNMKGEKMAKSLGNVVPLAATLDEFGAGVVRFFFLNSVYRNPLELVQGKSLPEAREAYESLTSPYQALREELTRAGLTREGRGLSSELESAATRLPEQLDATLSDDFNTREAVALLFRWSRTITEWRSQYGALSGTALAQLDAPFRWASEVLGLFEEPTPASMPFAALVEVAISTRNRARQRGDFAEADRIRAALAGIGILIEDTGGSSLWRLGPPAGR